MDTLDVALGQVLNHAPADADANHQEVIK